MSVLIEAVDVHKTYRVGKVQVPALRGISFSVDKGEFVSVVGPSGSGKSTLFYLLGGLARADSGRIVIDGDDFAQLSDAERTRMRKRKIGFVFQKFNLLPTLDARSNINIAVDIAGANGNRDAAYFDKIVGLLGLEKTAFAPALRAVWRRAATSRAGTGADQQTGDCAGRRAYRQPGFEELGHRVGHAAAFQSRTGPDRAHDYAQPGGRELRRSYYSHA